MGFSCDPATLVALAKCFSCIPREMQKPVELYLLATALGLDTSQAGAQALAKAAKCFKTCIPPEMRDAVEEYLLAQIAGCQ
jgi:hypothetical protein